MPSRRRLSRRTFLGSTAAVAGAAWTTGPALLRAQRGDKLRLAVIGCGGRGGDNLESLSGEHIAALCDVNRATLTVAAAAHPGARTEVDFRHCSTEPASSMRLSSAPPSTRTPSRRCRRCS